MRAASPIRVLVVDDDQRFAMAVTALLEAAGFEVVATTSDGAAAITAAREMRPDVVTLDIDMPVIDGVEATRLLREEHPDLPIVLVTGSESSERVDAAIALGATMRVSKEEVVDTLADVVRALVSSRERLTARPRRGVRLSGPAERRTAGHDA